MSLPEHISPLIREEMSLPREPSHTSLSDVLTLVESRFDDSLLDARGRSILHSVSSQIPGLLSSFWGIEILLDDAAPRADFLWQVDKEGAGLLKRARRSRHDPATKLAGTLWDRSPFWQEFGNFTEEWLDNPKWFDRLLNTWLEADTASAPGAVLDSLLDKPNMFWGASRQTNAGRELIRLLGTLGQRFYGMETDSARISAVADSIPSGSLVFQMGIMGARTKPVIRLCVKNPDMGEHERWLTEIGWPGNKGSLRKTLDWLRPLCGEIALNVDILSDKVGESLGIEIYSAERILSIETWQPLFDELLARRLARAEKLTALRNIPWSQRFRQLGVLMRQPPVGFPVLVMNLHHLKLIFSKGEVIKAKAYIGVFFPAYRYIFNP